MGLIARVRAAALMAAALAAFPAAAAPAREFVRIGAIHGVLTRPDTGPAPHVAILYENGDGTGSLLCTEMAKRGFVTLCLVEGQHPAGWETVALEMKAGMVYLRALPGITRVILYGHSGGGAVASFYQAVAENGVGFCQSAAKLWRCPDSLTDLPRADGIVFPDAHPGLAVMDMKEINPSLHGDGRRVTIDPALDPYNPANGFNPAGPSHYPAAFVARYGRAQASEEQRLIAQAQRLHADIASGAITDPAADLVLARAGRTSHLDELDPSIAATTATRVPRRLLRNDGSIVTMMIHSTMAPSLAAIPRGTISQARTSSATLFLSRAAVRARDTGTDIDWCSANSVTMCNVGAIRVPSLFIPSGANNFIGDDERMFEASPAPDKEYIVVEGATHGGAPCTACEPTPGAYANSAKNLFDYIRTWIDKRF